MWVLACLCQQSAQHDCHRRGGRPARTRRQPQGARHKLGMQEPCEEGHHQEQGADQPICGPSPLTPGQEIAPEHTDGRGRHHKEHQTTPHLHYPMPGGLRRGHRPQREAADRVGHTDPDQHQTQDQQGPQVPARPGCRRRQGPMAKSRVSRPARICSLPPLPDESRQGIIAGRVPSSRRTRPRNRAGGSAGSRW